MADTIDEATIIAWVDGELGQAQAARVAQAIADAPELAAMADRHRRMKARFAAAFGPIAEEPAAMPAPVVSLAAFRAERGARAAAPSPRWWGVGGAIAASLLAGILAGHGIGGGRTGVTDSRGALALSTPIAQALDGQLSGDGGAVRVALSFRDREGDYCRSFSGQNLAGVACHQGGGWQLRYASPASSQQSPYRMAGSDEGTMRFIQSSIAGEPMDRDAEQAARASHWGR